MIDHFNLPVSDLSASRMFYKTILYELGFSILVEEGDAIGFGTDCWAFGIVQEDADVARIHLAFTADSHQSVQAFYRSAIGAGARDNGEPGYRPQYGSSYYSAFVLDPDGHNVEAVCRKP